MERSENSLVRTFDQHACDLHAVATLLTPDPSLAEQLVVLAVTTSTPSDDLAGLSSVVVRGWLDGDPEQIDTITPVAPTVVDEVHALTAQQRASLALCHVGGHTYRDAATTLDLRPSEVAALLTSTLRSLQVAPPAPELSPEEQVG